jgi:GT2 family glycosyltransferase
VDVSIIIPLYNCLALTQATLRSLQETWPRDPEFRGEIILVDDGSTDGTREWLKTPIDFPRAEIRVVLNERNLGFAAANNRAAVLARGEFLLLLNNDVELTPSWLDELIAVARERMQAHGHGRSRTPAGIVGNVQLDFKTGLIDHAGIFINAKGKPTHRRTPPHAWARTREVAAVTGACLLVSRALWNELRGFDEAFINGGEDVDLCLRARERGRTTIVALRSVIRHHISASPGRKTRDEANSRRLVQRWRAQLVELGARAWCRDYIARDLRTSAAVARPFEAAHIFLYAHGWTRRVPRAARIGMEIALNREIARWDKLLGPAA